MKIWFTTVKVDLFGTNIVAFIKLLIPFKHLIVFLANKFQKQIPMAVHVYHPYRQPDATNYCKPLNGHCSHICVPAPQLTSNSAKTSCICPNGYKLEKDNLNCVTDSKYSILCSLRRKD